MADADGSGETSGTETKPGGWWVPKGAPVLAPAYDPPPTEGRDAELHDHLIDILDSASLQLPQLSDSSQHALSMLGKEDVDFKQLVEVVERDPALTAEVLRMVNSPAYRSVHDVMRLHLAFARIGRRPLRALMLGITYRSVALGSAGRHRTFAKELWQASVAAGALLETMCKPYTLSPDDGFLVGLLYNIGKLPVLKVVHDHETHSGQKVAIEMLELLCRERHQQMGQRLASEWYIPEPIPTVIAGQGQEPADDDPLKLWHLLGAFAEVACHMIGFAPYVPYDFFNLPCVQRLGLRDEPDSHELLRSLPKAISARSWS